MLRLALVCDYREEEWPSMDLVAEMLWTHLRVPDVSSVEVGRICPTWSRRFHRLPLISKKRASFNADRLLNRFWDYPRHLRSRLQEFDYFHICDHSYAHLVHELPAERTGVYCHDLDCFRCLLDPKLEPRPWWFRSMTGWILSGLQKAALVFCNTRVTEQRIRSFGLVDPKRLVYAPLGVSPEFTPLPQSSRPRSGGEGMRESGPIDRSGLFPFLLHVGSCIARKRIDVLLEVFAELKLRWPELQLIQVGGQWTTDQMEQIKRRGISNSVHQRRGIDRLTLADLYRQARIVLQPSDAEGFGLPILEALASGATVVASDIPALREVGGDGAVYCRVSDISQWVSTIEKLLRDASAAPDRGQRLEQARRFSWESQARTILQAYTSGRGAAA